ncbi:MAG: ABC transporter permease [Candidatus Dormibacteraceae bacterium]
MLRYALKRIGAVIVLLFAISIFVFLILHLIPGNPVQAILGGGQVTPLEVRRLTNQLGLNEPLPEQYLVWLKGVFTGNLGYSYANSSTVASLIGINLPWTLELSAAGLAVSLVLGTPLGVLAAVYRDGPLDTVTMAVALTCFSLPSFWLGLILILVFAVTLQLFPVVGGASLQGLVLPAVTLGLGVMGVTARFVRSSVVQAMQNRHVVTARAKGLTARRVFVRHVLRNSILPVLTVVGVQVGALLSGTVLIETVFSRPGVGRLLVQSILAKDYLTVQAIVLIIAAMYAVSNLVVDLLYPVLDPRTTRE